MTDGENDFVHIRGLASRPEPKRRPQCPQLRLTSTEWLYPVEGYCILERSAGRLMIPSIEEYRNYCTTARFHECCWFGGAESVVSTGAAGALQTGNPTRPELPPDLPCFDKAA